MVGGDEAYDIRPAGHMGRGEARRFLPQLSGAFGVSGGPLRYGTHGQPQANVTRAVPPRAKREPVLAVRVNPSRVDTLPLGRSATKVPRCVVAT